MRPTIHRMHGRAVAKLPGMLADLQRSASNPKHTCEHAIAKPGPLWRTMRARSHPETFQGGPMAKGVLHGNKMTKKPKKDTSPPKDSSGSDRPMPPMTTVIPRGKDKNK